MTARILDDIILPMYAMLNFAEVMHMGPHYLFTAMTILPPSGYPKGLIVNNKTQAPKLLCF
jgi:hypothetical protein